MDVLEALATRRSIRKYLDVPVEWDKIGQVLEAGRLAPSAGNLQEWRFIVVTKHETRKEIAESALSQHWIETAPVHIVVVALTEKVKIHYGMRGERLYTIQDCAACATYMMLAAHELGLGSCWIGAFDEAKLQRILNLPDEVRPQMLLTVGYADEKPHMPPRYPINNLVFLENYGGAGRIKDIDKVLWNHNVVGRAVGSVKETKKDFERLTKKDRGKLFERLKELRGSMSRRLRKR
jgi:nitroreductase